MYERLKAAAATPGGGAGNDIVLAQKAVEANLAQIAAGQVVEAARQALNSVRQMEDYLRVTAPFDGVVTERNVHAGALVGPDTGTEGAAPMLRLVNATRLRLVVPVPEAYTGGVSPGTELPFTVMAYPGEAFMGTVARISHVVDEDANDGGRDRRGEP